MKLHILNGDAIVEPIKKSATPGELMVWREMLCEGKATATPGEITFWAERKDFFEVQLETPAQEYAKKTIGEFDKLTGWQKFDELVLWFEYDLFCQINMLAALATCQALNVDIPISLICLGEHPSSTKLLGLGELAFGYYPELFASRTQLSSENVAFAAKVWEAWCASDHEQLRPFSEEEHAVFKYLAPALQAHFTRFPDKATGLNQLETDMLQLIEEGLGTERKVVGSMLRKENYFGFGDLQYFWYLDLLAPLLAKEGEILQLNELGKKVLKGEANFAEIIENKKRFYFGGARKYGV
ncbi:hypothetical protein R9C00_23005 [Flammeovirgaceae bacterium SG7u.111]|nr:hypothetical protein [Flammeovirgaceae bacterium SG7u.132]WPO34574.1 hypothetical protein R9C00_23005 [Flammeovirgaceae bacterium SG7u.111]